MNQITSFEDSITQQVFMARVTKLAEDVAKEMGVDIDRVGNAIANYNVITFNMSFKVKRPKYTTQTHSQVFGTGPITKEEIKVGFKFRLKTHVFFCYREKF